MQETPTWHELLKKFLMHPHERQRIAKAIGVNVVTLTRWANGQMPRSQNLSQLLNALMPEQRKRLLELMPEDMLELLNSSPETHNVPNEVPSHFYSDLLLTYVSTPSHMRFRTFCDLIFQQILKQFDASRQGLEVTVAVCMPPTEAQKIYSLREIIGRGTFPWKPLLERRTLFLAAESLAGFVARTGQERAVQSHNDGYNLFPAHWLPYEESAAAFPLLSVDKVAGSLIVSSTQRNYFTPARMALLRDYANLMVLSFEPQEFYPIKWLQLFPMPPHEIQKQYFTQFRPRVEQAMVASRVQNQKPITLTDAEQLIWKQMEMELLRLQAERARQDENKTE